MRRFPLVLGLAVASWALWWLVGVVLDFRAVSPVHWHLLFPKIALEILPVGAGLATAAMLLQKKRGAYVALLIFAGATIYSHTVTLFAPDIVTRYERTVHETRVTVERPEVS